MSDRRTARAHGGGFTLTELLVTISILVGLMLVGVGFYYRMNRGFALRAAVSRIESVLQGARTFAAQERGRVIVMVEPQPEQPYDRQILRIYALGRRTESCWHFEASQFDLTAKTLKGALGQQGTLEGGATWTPGRIGHALLLDGSGGDVRVTAPQLDGIREGVYIDAYVRPDPAGLSDDALLPIVSKQGTGGSPYTLALHYKRTATQDLFWLEGSVTNGDGTVRAHTEAVIPAGEWTHVALAYDRDGSRDVPATPGLVLRINGREVDLPVDVSGKGTLVQNTAELLIGADGTNHFKGSIDELKIASLVADEKQDFPKNTEIYVDTGNTLGRIYYDDEGKLDPRYHGRIVRFRVIAPKDQLSRVVQVNWLGGVEVLTDEREVDQAEKKEE